MLFSKWMRIFGLNVIQSKVLLLNAVYHITYKARRKTFPERKNLKLQDSYKKAALSKMVECVANSILHIYTHIYTMVVVISIHPSDSFRVDVSLRYSSKVKPVRALNTL
jgi:hypothetical protein